jgi:hypothetical protein
MTIVFGKQGTNREGHAMISDGHIPGWEFYDEDSEGVKGHDHIGPGPQPDKFRDRYTGWESFHDPE